MSSSTSPIKLKSASDLGVTADTIGLGNVENKSSSDIRAEIVASDLAGAGNAFAVLPASGATVGAQIGVNFTGQFTSANVENFFAAKVITAGIIDVTDLFAQSISVTDTVKVGGTSSRYELILDGRGTASPIAIIDKTNNGSLVFGFDSEDRPYFSGGLRQGSIESINVFTDEVLTQLTPVVTGATGGVYKLAGTPMSLVNNGTLTKVVTIDPANSAPVAISVSFADSRHLESNTNQNYSTPSYRLEIRRKVNGGTSSILSSKILTGTYSNRYEAESGGWFNNFNIQVDDTFTDNTHTAGSNDTLEYTILITHNSGSRYDPLLKAVSCAQQTQGGGIAGVAGQLTAPYVGLEADGGAFPYLAVENNPAGSDAWIRLPQNGLLPFSQGGGSSSLGTSTWQFSQVHGQLIYENGQRVYSAGNRNIGSGQYNYAAGNHNHDGRYLHLNGGDTMEGTLHLGSGLNGGITWEGGQHGIYNNDGGGNFNFRIGNKFSGSSHVATANNGTPFHQVWSDDNNGAGSHSFNVGNGVDYSVGSAIGWRTQMIYDKNYVQLNYQGGQRLNTTSDGVKVTGTLTSTGNITTNDIYASYGQFSNRLRTDELRNYSGAQLVLHAGESYNYATGQTGEYVYVNAESGLQINSSPDNWSSGWAGRNTATICDASGNSVFPGNVKAPTFEGNLDGKLSTPVKINNTWFDGSLEITTSKWGTSRKLTIGNKDVWVNGGGNAEWTLEAIGAAREVRGTFYNVTNTGWTRVARVNGARLGSVARFVVNGTANSNVVAAEFTIVCSHNSKILISGTSTNYTAVSVRVVSNGNEHFDVFIKTNRDADIALECLAAPLAVDTVITLNPTGVAYDTYAKEFTIPTNGFGSTGRVVVPSLEGELTGNADTATKLKNSRTINGTSFDGGGNITTSYWGSTRTFTIGRQSVSVNGSGNVSFSPSSMFGVPLEFPNSDTQQAQSVAVQNDTAGDNTPLAYSTLVGFYDSEHRNFQLASDKQGNLSYRSSNGGTDWFGWYDIYHTGNLPNFIRADQGDSFSGKLESTNRQGGIFGSYNSNLVDHIWSMGTGYVVASDGSDFGNLYGMAYVHTNNTNGLGMAGGHQVVFCTAGTANVSIGLGGNIWVKNAVTAGSFKGNLNADQLVAGTVPNARISGSYTGLVNLTGSGNVDFARFRGLFGDSAGAPSYSWTSDTNTGMYLAAQNEIGISAGATRRLKIGMDEIRSYVPLSADMLSLSGDASKNYWFMGAEPTGSAVGGSAGNVTFNTLGGVTNWAFHSVCDGASGTQGFLWHSNTSGSTGTTPLMALSAINGNLTCKGTITSGGNMFSTGGRFLSTGNTVIIAKSGSQGGTMYFRPNGENQTSGQVTIDTSGALRAQGIVYGSDCIATSDRRMKDNLVPIKDAMAKVDQLQGYTFDRKDMEGRRHAGLIAQDVREVLPEAIFGTKEHLQLSSTAVVGLLVEAIKELSARVKQLEAA